MAGKVVIDTVETSAGDSASAEEVVKGCAKAWVNFNGTGTVVIRTAFNVSSITDNGTGDYTANFTTAIRDANYATTTSGGNAGSIANTGINEFSKSTTQFRFQCRNFLGTLGDRSLVSATIFR